MKKRKVISVLLALTLIGSCLAGCQVKRKQPQPPIAVPRRHRLRLITQRFWKKMWILMGR